MENLPDDPHGEQKNEKTDKPDNGVSHKEVNNDF